VDSGTSKQEWRKLVGYFANLKNSWFDNKYFATRASIYNWTFYRAPDRALKSCWKTHREDKISIRPGPVCVVVLTSTLNVTMTSNKVRAIEPEREHWSCVFVYTEQCCQFSGFAVNLTANRERQRRKNLQGQTSSPERLAENFGVSSGIIPCIYKDQALFQTHLRVLWKRCNRCAILFVCEKQKIPTTIVLALDVMWIPKFRWKVGYLTFYLKTNLNLYIGLIGMVTCAT